jgi:hypothetical protein
MFWILIVALCSIWALAVLNGFCGHAVPPGTFKDINLDVATVASFQTPYKSLFTTQPIIQYCKIGER